MKLQKIPMFPAWIIDMTVMFHMRYKTEEGQGEEG